MPRCETTMSCRDDAEFLVASVAVNRSSNDNPIVGTTSWLSCRKHMQLCAADLKHNSMLMVHRLL